MALHTKREILFRQNKGKWDRYWERMGNLQDILKLAACDILEKIKGRNRAKYLKIWNKQIKQLTEATNLIRNG